MWRGCTKLTADDLQFFAFVQLPDGRLDINLPPELVEALLPAETFSHTLSLFGEKFRIAYVNLLIHPPSNTYQSWHQDNASLAKDEYFTLLMPLVNAPGMGKTELVVPYTWNLPKAPKTCIPDVKVGQGLVFSGCLWHRGTANWSTDTRYCLYMVVTSAKPNDPRLFENWQKP